MKSKLEIANDLYFDWRMATEMLDSGFDWTHEEVQEALGKWRLAFAQLSPVDADTHWAGLKAIQDRARDKACRLECIREEQELRRQGVPEESEPCELIPAWAAFDSEGAF